MTERHQGWRAHAISALAADAAARNQPINLGLLDPVLTPSADGSRAPTRRVAKRVPNDRSHDARPSEKRRRRAHDQPITETCNTAELSHRHECLFGPRPQLPPCATTVRPQEPLPPRS
jgi:hypothetical protein